MADFDGNPFEDPEVNPDDVTKPLSPKQPQGDSSSYGGTNANNTTTTTTHAVVDESGQPVSQQQQQQGVSGQAHRRPEQPDFCVKLYMWFPVRMFALGGGIALIVAVIVDWISFKTTFLYKIIACYLFIFGILIVFMESPVYSLTRTPQLLIYYWFRILSRMWGRAVFYIFSAILTFGELEHDNFTLASIVGFYLFFLSIIMIIISHSSATKYRRMFIFIAQGSDPENKEEITNRLTNKFNELDLDKDEKIGTLDIIRLGQESGRILTNAERHSIQTFLDINCNGSVTKDDFVNQYLNHNIKQKWL